MPSPEALADAICLEDDLSSYADLAFDHPDLADTYFDEGAAAIAATGAEASRRAHFRRQVYGGAIQGLMASDATATLARLEFGTFDDRIGDTATRASLTAIAAAKAREQAAEAKMRETETAAREATAEGLAVLDLTTRVETGAALEGDVETAFRAGAIADAQRDGLLAIVASRRQARLARIAAVTFVARALKGETTLDSENSDHRVAVDIFHEEKFAAEGGTPKSLVAATGIVPTAVGRSIHIGLLNADPGDRTAVLRRLAELLGERTVGEPKDLQIDANGAEQ